MNRWQDEHGYTLVESLVAMSLFVTVVLWMLGSVGNLMFSENTGELEQAMRIGQTELSHVDRRMLSENKKMVEGYIVDCRVTKSDNLAEVTVRISTRKHPERLLLSLTRLMSLSE